jgi:hypothetical protein
MSAYFDAGKLPDAVSEYICFVDIMGIQSKMAHSIKQSGNYVFKLHATILESWRVAGYKSISVYPIMDGAYITSRYKSDLLNFLTYIYKSLSEALLMEKEFKHWYLIRAAIAFGSVIHGRNIPYDASLEFSSRVGYKEQLLMGAPMIKAYRGESRSAPMGIFVDESASVKKWSIPCDWKWFNNDKIKVEQSTLDSFRNRLIEYYGWLSENEDNERYKIERRLEHLQQLKKYFEV